MRNSVYDTMFQRKYTFSNTLIASNSPSEKILPSATIGRRETQPAIIPLTNLNRWI